MTTIGGFEYAVLSAESFSVKCVDHALYPRVIGSDGETEEEDAGNIAWPSDAEISRVASKLYGHAVKVRFSDAGDHPDHAESIYGVQSA